MCIISHQRNGEFEDWDVQSHSNNNQSYLVTLDHEEGTVYCTCPHFQYRLQTERFGGARLDDNEHHCKHILEVLSNGKEE